MTSGIWDQTLFDEIQKSVHECLKYGVVRDFSDHVASMSTSFCSIPCSSIPCSSIPCSSIPCSSIPCSSIPCSSIPCSLFLASVPPSHLFIEGKKSQMEPAPMTTAHFLLERYDGALKQDKEQGRKGPITLNWFKKKTHTIAAPKKDKKHSFLGKYSQISRDEPREPVTVAPAPQPAAEGDAATAAAEEMAKVHRERLTQQRLQQQIQLLRSLHQHQNDNPNEEGFRDTEQYNTLEFSTATTLSKSTSMPAILQRGVSVVHLKRN
jgi:hypothetical protein